MCYNCGGRGVVDCGFLFLDEETCRMCNGTFCGAVAGCPSAFRLTLHCFCQVPGGCSEPLTYDLLLSPVPPDR